MILIRWWRSYAGCLPRPSTALVHSTALRGRMMLALAREFMDFIDPMGVWSISWSGCGRNSAGLLLQSLGIAQELLPFVLLGQWGCKGLKAGGSSSVDIGLVIQCSIGSADHQTPIHGRESSSSGCIVVVGVRHLVQVPVVVLPGLQVEQILGAYMIGPMTLILLS